MASLGIGFSKQPDESYRDAVARIAGKCGLDNECLEIFDRLIAQGDTETEAAWCALYEWDCLDLIDGD